MLKAWTIYLVTMDQGIKVYWMIQTDKIPKNKTMLNNFEWTKLKKKLKKTIQGF